VANTVKKDRPKPMPDHVQPLGAAGLRRRPPCKTRTNKKGTATSIPSHACNTKVTGYSGQRDNVGKNSSIPLAAATNTAAVTPFSHGFPRPGLRAGFVFSCGSFVINRCIRPLPSVLLPAGGGTGVLGASGPVLLRHRSSEERRVGNA